MATNLRTPPARLGQPLLACFRSRCTHHAAVPAKIGSAGKQMRLLSSTGSRWAATRRYAGSVDAVTFHRVEAQRKAYYVRRLKVAGAGVVACLVASAVTIALSDIPKVEKNDSPKDDPLNNLERGTPVVGGVSGGTEIRKPGAEGTAGTGAGGEVQEGGEQVSTGTSTIPYFPKSLELASADPSAVGQKAEYQLLGLGIRTVSFLSIQVYVVGLYVATEDIAALQQALVRKIDPVATTLIKSEKTKLREMLLNPEQGEEIWDSILRDGKIRSAIRIVPTRNTDFQHLRDGWVRGITGRVQAASQVGKADFEDEAFGEAMSTFKGVFSGGARKSIPKATTLLLLRSRIGSLDAWYDDGAADGPVKMGTVQDERISRLVWLNYLAGQKVASEGARQNIVEGVMDFVERPIGTVATMVT